MDKMAGVWLLLLLFFFLHQTAEGLLGNGRTQRIKVGILVQDVTPASVVERYEKHVERFNGQQLRDSPFVFEPKTTYFSRNDSFLSAKSACQLVENGAMAAYATATPIGAGGGGGLDAQGDNLASVFNFFGIPFLQANPSLLWDQQKTKYGAEVNIFPARPSLTKVSTS